MRLALVGDYPLNSNDIRTGPQAAFVYLLDGLKLFPDLDIHVITARKEIKKSHLLEREGVNFYYLPHPHLPTELSFFVLRPRIHRTLQTISPDLIHSQDAYLYGMMCLSSGYPTVLTPHNVHGTEVAFTGGSLLNRFRLRYHFSVTRHAFIRKARHIVSISPYIRDSYASVVRAQFYDIDNPISEAYFNLTSNREDPTHLLFVGMLRTRKRPELALAALNLAIKRVPGLHLSMAGAAVEPVLYKRMGSFVAEHHLQENVHLLGHLNETQLLDTYESASILLLTSDLETSPMSVQQALAAGKPVVATDSGGTRYLIEQGRNGFVVERNNPAHLAEALVRLATDDALRKTFGQAARRAARARFRSDHVATKLYEMYQGILQYEHH